MREGDLFEIDGKVFRFDSFQYDDQGWAAAYVAKCLTPGEDEGTWWCFTLDYEANMALPSAVTIH